MVEGPVQCKRGTRNLFFCPLSPSPTRAPSTHHTARVFPSSLDYVRRVAARKRELLARFAARASSATKLQSAWRGKMARDSYLRARCSWLASREIQRMYRGHLGRRAARRRREWQSAGPGPERLKLGLRMIGDTKVGRWATRRMYIHTNNEICSPSLARKVRSELVFGGAAPSERPSGLGECS